MGRGLVPSYWESGLASGSPFAYELAIHSRSPVPRLLGSASLADKTPSLSLFCSFRNDEAGPIFTKCASSEGWGVCGQPYHGKLLFCVASLLWRAVWVLASCDGAASQ
jgi:hypothetical protein